ncbi:uncharacterized protein SCHCODRAFT_02598165 [Schizophyllum commune H4-8]|uniref:Uncharacterized protein n=1 Tax=Schizophyllum commune (strain H4-8 / FGSC 9210) TaxID=578458 RepID=D8Q3B7_SCHCM|nr:uncharacterized protein SCHCODRAFT_02598165 [Schizophyllum commune H4-8]KAI5894821.1 hypothetical protein SCHCODRAFT_02598165 [Schizophyllum commune H4-8]
MHKYQPKDLTAARLSVAVAAEMKQWVKLTKAAAQADDTKIDLKSSGRVEDLCARLAEFFGIDLKAPIIPLHLSGGVSVKKEGNIDAAIRAKQWEDWHALGDEWVAAVDQKIPFRLQELNQDIPIVQDRALVSMISRVVAKFPRLPSDPAMPSQDEMLGVSRQTIGVWIEVVYKHHDRVALMRLHALHDLLYTASEASLRSADSDSVIVGTSNIELITLPTAHTLPEAIAQCESGLVARIRDAYGPPDGKKGTSKNSAVWAQYRGRITRRERLHSILQLDFRGDKDCFLAFFTKPKDSVPRQGAKRSHATMESADTDTHTFYAVNDVVEVLPKCRKAVAQATYGLDDAERAAKWGGMNDFEIWRALGTEQYGSRK